MATRTQAGKKPATGRVRVAAGDAVIPAQRGLDEAPATDAAVDDEERVTVIIPEDVTLTLDNGHPVSYSAGIDDIPRSHAEHWYAKARGVRLYSPDDAAEG